ncbi:uncharacterized protein PG986_001445 [Apiospora aurea]|uniref:Glycoside hydrolase family 39 protein n=1 Tax=Apiospora aurea TaxID=335848 RepID=A0ABR1QWY4_9PEZI
MQLILSLTTLATCAIAGSVLPRDSNTAVEDLAATRGSPKHWASGFIYGIPDNEDQVAQHWYEDIGFRWGRTGGAQYGAPKRGWNWGRTEYQGRLQSTLSNYRSMRKVGAECIIYPHDIWGTDSLNSSSYWPGDNGNWQPYEAFVKALMEDLASNNALEGLVWDIWNEPDIEVFWKRDTQRWIDLYIRTHKILRADSRFANVPITGPSLAWRPMSSNKWWTSWLQAIADAGTVPDQYSYHLEGDLNAQDNDPQYTNQSLGALLRQHGLPERQVSINEYAAFNEMIPSGYAWWISRLERFDWIGLLGNWQGGTTLHDLFANLLTKSRNPRDYGASDYAAAPGYHVYRYYARNMTGVRVGTTGSEDGRFDAYATLGEDRVRVLAGPKVRSGQWKVQVEGLAAAGYADASGSVDVESWEFQGSNAFAVTGPPAYKGVKTYQYSSGSVIIPVSQTNNYTAHAFEIAVKKG